MRMMKLLNMKEQLRDLFGGSLNEVLTKAVVGMITILWGIANDTALLLFVFLSLLFVDAVFGVLLSRRKKIRINGFYLVAGPFFKLIITTMVMFAMAMLDNFIRSAPLVGVYVSTPITIGIGGVACFGLAFDVLLKYAELARNPWIITKAREWFSRFIPPAVPKDDQTPPA